MMMVMLIFLFIVDDDLKKNYLRFYESLSEATHLNILNLSFL